MAANKAFCPVTTPLDRQGRSVGAYCEDSDLSLKGFSQEEIVYGFDTFAPPHHPIGLLLWRVILTSDILSPHQDCAYVAWLS